jgi:hypothetical protein
VLVGKLQIVGGVHGDDAVHLSRVARVDRLDACVRDRRPHEREMEEPVDRQIVEIVRLTGEDPRVLLATDRVPENRARRRHLPSLSRRGGTLPALSGR